MENTVRISMLTMTTTQKTLTKKVIRILPMEVNAPWLGVVFNLQPV